MLIDVFKKGQGGGSAPVDYLIALDVPAYDENRNVLRDENGDVIIKRRDPPPDIMRGDPNITRDLINSCPFKWAYVSGVVAFALEDKPTEAQQQDVMDVVEGLAFAGLQPEQYNILWVRHTHEGKVELHFCLPRLELISGKSINPFPPGFEKAFNSPARRAEQALWLGGSLKTLPAPERRRVSRRAKAGPKRGMTSITGLKAR